jgi:hypothetical protein
VSPRFCEYCGSRLSEGAKLCIDCGKLVPGAVILNNTQDGIVHLNASGERIVLPDQQPDIAEGGELLSVTQSPLSLKLFPHSLVATKKGLILREPHFLLHATITEIPYEQIHSIKKKGGLICATIQIISGVYGNIEISCIWNRNADAMIALVHEQQAKQKSLTTRQQQTQFSTAEELQKLAALKNDGTLTSAEFKEQKRKLLDK